MTADDTILVRLPREFANSMQTHRSTDALACTTQQTLIDACRDALTNPVAPAESALAKIRESVCAWRDALVGESASVPCDRGWVVREVGAILQLLDALANPVAPAEPFAPTAWERKRLIQDRDAAIEQAKAAEKDRDRYHDALVARHGGEPVALLKELDEARGKLAAAEKERDEARAALAELRAGPTPEEIEAWTLDYEEHNGKNSCKKCCDFGDRAVALMKRAAAAPSRQPTEADMDAFMRSVFGGGANDPGEWQKGFRDGAREAMRRAAAPPSDDRLLRLLDWLVDQRQRIVLQGWTATEANARLAVLESMLGKVHRLLAAPDHVRGVTKMVSAPQAPAFEGDPKDCAFPKVFAPRAVPFVEVTFRDALRNVLNQHSKENGSNTPDWILADFLCNCLGLFDAGVKARQAWYGQQSEAPASSLGDPRAVSASGDKGIEVCRTTFAAPAATPDEAVPELPEYSVETFYVAGKGSPSDQQRDALRTLWRHVRALTAAHNALAARVAGRR